MTPAERFYAVIRRIPKGRVATYGQIARLAGFPAHARQVGHALGALPDKSPVPWQRVVNAKGAISPRVYPGYEQRQRDLLEAEGVQVSRTGQVDLKVYLWAPEED
jgi:methylated-DNA-protein-cysteine methyltransferase related protein